MEHGEGYDLPDPCSAETRFQGIATLTAPLPDRRRGIPGLAVLRPVFRGLRPSLRGLVPLIQQQACSAETRFQGIATSRIGGDVRDAWKPPLAVLRPVFRGLRRGLPGSVPSPGKKQLAVLRPVFRGLRHANFPAGDCFGFLQTCSAETRFQGIATPPPPLGWGFLWAGSCSAETRFQGIATRS